jgi:hypothetical protein
MSWFCIHCGTSSTTGDLCDHECDKDILVAYQREQFDAQFVTFLSSPRGKFALYIARKQVVR